MTLVFTIFVVLYLTFFIGCAAPQPQVQEEVVLPTVIPLIAGANSLCIYGGVSIGYNGQTTAICNGATGPAGPQGAPGTDVSSITVVQFCPGVTPNYPSVFPEIGFLINGVIYAVYSSNDGFLSVIPPGVYSSNAVGSSCTFTVNSNGTITN